MWEEEWTQLSDNDKEQFANSVNTLLASTFVVREVVDPKEKTTAINRQYRFIERHYELIRDYLRCAGWELVLDNAFGVASVYHAQGQGLVRLDKLATYLLYVLRLIYEEGREKLSLRKDVTASVGDVVEKMFHLGLLDRKPADKALKEALLTLKNYNLLDRVDGEWTDPETKLVIYPSIIILVSNERIQQLYKGLQQAGEESAGSREEDGDHADS